ncbi:MAG: hypothetical protein WCJ09_05240 [Planctomycetota bacterium]
MIVPLAQQTRSTLPDREILSRWGWVEPHVWTARMLTTLEQGVEGGECLFRGSGLFVLTTAREFTGQSSRR